MIVQPKLLCSFDVKSYARWVGSRRYHKVIFQLSLIAVVHHVYTGIDVLIPHLCVVPDIRAPQRWIVSDEVVARARYLIQAAHPDSMIGIAELQLQHTSCFWLGRIASRHMTCTVELRLVLIPVQREHNFIIGKEQRVPGKA